MKCSSCLHPTASKQTFNADRGACDVWSTAVTSKRLKQPQTTPPPQQILQSAATVLGTKCRAKRSKYPTSAVTQRADPAPLFRLCGVSGPRRRPRPDPFGGDAGAGGGVPVPRSCHWRRGSLVEDLDQMVEDLGWSPQRVALKVEVLGHIRRVAWWEVWNRRVAWAPVDGTHLVVGGWVWWPNDVDWPPGQQCNPQAAQRLDLRLCQAKGMPLACWISPPPQVTWAVAICHPAWPIATPSGSGGRVSASFPWGCQPSAKAQVFPARRCSWAVYHRQKAQLRSKSKAVRDLPEPGRPSAPPGQWRKGRPQRLGRVPWPWCRPSTAAPSVAALGLHHKASRPCRGHWCGRPGWSPSQHVAPRPLHMGSSRWTWSSKKMLQCWTLEIIPSSYMLLPRLPMYLPIAN